MKLLHLTISAQLCVRAQLLKLAGESYGCKGPGWVVKMRMKWAVLHGSVETVVKMEKVNFASGEDIERALMDLGPLLGVTIKEEVQDELPDAAAAAARLNVSKHPM